MKDEKLIKDRSGKVELTYLELLDLISFCKCDIKNTEFIIHNINSQDTDFIDAMKEDIKKNTELIKKLETLKSTMI